jgi:hypothetical protein
MVTQDRARLVAEPLAQGEDDARLADARLPGQEHDLAFALLGLPPAIEEETELQLATDERREALGVQALEAPLETPGPQDLERPHRLGEAPEGARAEILHLEQPTDQAPRALGDDHLPRLRQGLQPRGEVRGLADDGLLLGRTFADQIADDDQPGSDADPRRQCRARGRLQPADHLGDRQPSAHCPLGLVFVCLGPAEVGQHAVAHELGDEALEASDHPGRRVLIGAEHLAHVLGIELGRQFGRADQIDEHHRQLPPLGLARGRPRSWLSGLGAGIGRSGVERRYPLEQPLPVSKVEPKLLEIGIGQVAQDVAVDAVLCERLRMMAKPLLSEPARDLEHCTPQAIA